MPHAAIDIHTPILPPGWGDWAQRFGVTGWPACKLHDACNATIHLGEKEFRKVDERSFLPARRIADMDVDHPLAQLEGMKLDAAALDDITHKTARRFLRLRQGS